MSKVFFTSDHHFYHANVIKYANRPFENVEEMNEVMIQNINSLVGENDSLYILGDFAFAKDAKQVIHIRSRIKCKNVHWIKGNHDKYAFHSSVKPHFLSIRDYCEIEVNGQKIVLFHFPILEWNRGHRGAWMLHGHTHGNLKIPEQLKNKRITDVGVDCWNFFPVSFEQLQETFKNCENIIHHD